MMRRSVKERVDCAATRLKRRREGYNAIIRISEEWDTDFPKKSLPSMMTLTFLKGILERDKRSGTNCREAVAGEREDHGEDKRHLRRI